MEEAEEEQRVLTRRGRTSAIAQLAALRSHVRLALSHQHVRLTRIALARCLEHDLRHVAAAAEPERCAHEWLRSVAGPAQPRRLPERGAQRRPQHSYLYGIERLHRLPGALRHQYA